MLIPGLSKPHLSLVVPSGTSGTHSPDAYAEGEGKVKESGENEHVGVCAADRIFERHRLGLPPELPPDALLRTLRLIDAQPLLIGLVARTEPAVQQIQRLLNLWRESGCPDPATLPDNDPLRVDLELALWK